MIFSVEEVPTGRGMLQYRRELLTGFRSRISPERSKRGISMPCPAAMPADGCPFCPDRVSIVTPTFEDGTRIQRGESVTFPNLFPFAAWHTVTVITRAHGVERFTRRQIRDALGGQIESLQGRAGYPSINWNYLPTSGASIVHPHLQGLVDRHPSAVAERYILASHRYLLQENRCYWDVYREEEAQTPRYLFGDEIPWFASAVPLGEKEIRGILPLARLEELEPYLEPLAAGIEGCLDLYRHLGTSAFNMAIFFDSDGSDHGFRAFCSLIARINPNISGMSDSAFMERLHREPVILTPPEDLSAHYRDMRIGKGAL